MTADGMRPENSRACLSPSQSPSHRVEETEGWGAEQSGSEQQRAAVVEAAVDGSLDFLRVGALGYHRAFSIIITTQAEVDQTLLQPEICWPFSSGSSPTYQGNENASFSERPKVSVIN